MTPPATPSTGTLDRGERAAVGYLWSALTAGDDMINLMSDLGEEGDLSLTPSEQIYVFQQRAGELANTGTLPAILPSGVWLACSRRDYGRMTPFDFTLDPVRYAIPRAG